MNIEVIVSQDVYVFEVTEKNFDTVVLQNSAQLPVFVEFMGAWSGPSLIMSELFTSLAKEFAGLMIFAKVDIDEQAELLKKYQIENVPTMKVFQQGECVHVEEGQLQETEARALLKEFGIYHESDLLREQAREKHLAGDTTSAILLLTEAIKKDPKNTRIAMDMVQVFIDIKQYDQAKDLFNKIPENDKKSEMGKALTGQLVFIELASKTDGTEELSKRLANDSDDHTSRFDLAICQVAEHNIEEAMDNLFQIVTQAPEFKGGAAREMIITLIRMLEPVNPVFAQEYQRRLSNILSQ